jgi:hypothetical protein
VIPALGRWRQEDGKVKVSLGYIDPVSKKQNKNKSNNNNETGQQLKLLCLQK